MGWLDPKPKNKEYTSKRWDQIYFHNEGQLSGGQFAFLEGSYPGGTQLSKTDRGQLSERPPPQSEPRGAYVWINKQNKAENSFFHVSRLIRKGKVLKPHASRLLPTKLQEGRHKHYTL